MAGVAEGTGASALSAWLATRAARADRIHAVEEALLARRFPRYAAKRLSGLFVTRLWATGIHLVELTLLVELFAARGLVASLAFHNVALVVDAAYWGATEALRRRVRELGPSAQAASVVRRWLTGATWLALACVLAPIVNGAYLARAAPSTPPVLVGYGVAVGARVAIDVLLRTYYSGVFAHGRVYRPIATFLVGPFVLLATTWLGAPLFGPWSFVLGVVLGALVSRGLAFVFIRRAYRVSRIPAPSLRLVLFPRRTKSAVHGPHARDVILGAIANTSTRIGSVVLLAAVIPSLSAAASTEDDDLVRLAMALHLAGPIFVVAASWASVFYHDWKRLEDHAASLLARALARRLHVVAAGIALVCWLGIARLVTLFTSWEAAEPTLLALAPACLGASIWAAVQLRGFARGAFVDQAASAVAMAVVVWVALSADPEGDLGWYVAVAIGPWVAVGVHAIAGLAGRTFRREGAALGSLPVFVRLLRAARGEVVVRRARVTQQVGPVAMRIARALGRDGACLRLGAKVLWFEPAPGRGLAAWLAIGGGLLDKVKEVGRGSGVELAAKVVADDVSPDGDGDALARLRAEFAERFPGGFVLGVGEPPPSAYLALPAVVRQAVWRDAVRELQGKRRSRSGFGVVPYAPDGAIRAVFAAPKPLDSEATRAFRSAVEAAGVRLR